MRDVRIAELAGRQFNRVSRAQLYELGLSDDAIAGLLKQRGFDCARRTVVKYRESMGLGSSIQRRRQRKIAGAA